MLSIDRVSYELIRNHHSHLYDDCFFSCIWPKCRLTKVNRLVGFQIHFCFFTRSSSLVCSPFDSGCRNIFLCLFLFVTVHLFFRLFRLLSAFCFVSLPLLLFSSNPTCSLFFTNLVELVCLTWIAYQTHFLSFTTSFNVVLRLSLSLSGRLHALILVHLLISYLICVFGRSIASRLDRYQPTVALFSSLSLFAFSHLIENWTQSVKSSFVSSSTLKVPSSSSSFSFSSSFGSVKALPFNTWPLYSSPRISTFTCCC